MWLPLRGGQRKSGGLWVRVAQSAGKVDVVPGAPELVVDLDALWAEIDQLLLEA